MLTMQKPTRSGWATLQAGLQPYPGHQLRYFLGSGGFGEVWEAEVDGGAPVALKFMPSNRGRTAQQEMRAIQLLWRLDSPHLVHIDRVWAFQQYIVIAMELAEGGLDSLLQLYKAECGTPIPA